VSAVATDVTLSVADARSLACDLFVASDAPADHAALVADHLVESSLVGAHSHGMIRIPQYLDQIAGGDIDPRASPVIERSMGALTVIDGRCGFGQVAMQRAVNELARGVPSGVAVAVVRRAGHAGRIGAYVEALARSGIASVAFCSTPVAGHYVAPFGGKEGRFGTNPIAYAFPTAADPIVADFSTSAISEGKVRYLRNKGLRIAPGALRLPDGTPTADPDALYGEPAALLQPLGGDHFGYKGSMLAMLVELFTSIVIGDDPLTPDRKGNTVTLIAFAVAELSPALASRLASYVRSCVPTNGRTVVVPGDRENESRERREIEIDAHTWAEISLRARGAGVSLPVERGRGFA
jgi:uncharacterized oxidoreductase